MAPDTVIHAGRSLSLVHRETKLPGRGWVTIEVVRHPGAVAIVPLLRDSQLLLIRQYRPAFRDWLWEIPAGTLRAGEEPRECAARELLEETGFAASFIEKLGVINMVPDFSDDVVHVFIARGLEQSNQSLEHDEVIEVFPVSLGQAVKMIQSGEITDAKTMISILLFTMGGSADTAFPAIR